MIGAIIGDICGSVYEKERAESIDFELFTPLSTFTDDTILSVAVADATLNNLPYDKTLQSYAKAYPRRWYGASFWQWVDSEELKPYGSYANGSAMRVSSIGWLAKNEHEVLSLAQKSAQITHNHIEGINGAKAVALAIFLAKNGATKEEIRSRISKDFSYDLSHSFQEELLLSRGFDSTCKGSIPPAILAFLDSNNYEQAIRNAIWLKGDADTQACIARAIAQAYYGYIPSFMIDKAYEILPKA